MRTLSLNPKRTRRPSLKENVRYDTRPKQKRKTESYDTTPKARRSYDTRDMDEIGLTLKWSIRTIDDKRLRDTLYRLVRFGVKRSEPEPVFLKLLSGIEKKQSKKMDMKRFFISNSMKYCYFGAKQAIPQIKAFEKIADGVLTKDIKKISLGMVETITGENFATILVQLIES